MSYVFYPGCSLESTAKDYALSTNAVAAALGIDLPELAGWTCCGSTAAHQTDALLALALPAANLAAASGKTVAVACAACYSRLKLANHEIAGDPDSRRRVADALGADYDGSTPVKHVLEILRDDVGMAAIADKVKRPLAGLRVAAYYGCLLVRPPSIMRFDDAENPAVIDKLMTAAGAEAIDWSAKTDCCGASFSITKTEIVLRLSRAVLTAAREAGADCIVTACPLCQFNLDMRQSDIEKKNNEHFGLPAFYFTQLLGLALGLQSQRLGLQSLLVDPLPLLTRKGILQPEKAVAR
ncbi:MAG: CoB--CoM heterodisulfide reductase iron-sulfur subunit B family protein [Dehalococcoidia bacterium]